MGMEINAEPFTYTSDDGTVIACVRWLTPAWNPRGVIQIAHGMGEHIGRYRAFAEFLCQKGWTVYGSDHRGHGRTLTNPALRGDFGAGGFRAVVADMVALNDRIRENHPKSPLVLFGHSMGSFAAQHFVLKHSDHIDALVLSGSGSLDGIRDVVQALGPAAAVERLTSRIRPLRTPFDWLSTDPSAVDAFANDVHCFPALTESSAASVLTSASDLADENKLRGIRTQLPIRFYSGSDDPIGQYVTGVLNAAQRYKLAGIRSVSVDIEMGARHELINERQRLTVMGRIAAWMDAATPKAR